MLEKVKSKKEKKILKTFTLHEKNKKFVQLWKKVILQHKHVENILNILVEYEFKNNNKDMVKLLLNKIIMKAVLFGNTGGDKTCKQIKQVNDYFENHNNKQLFIQAKEACIELNDKNVGEVIGRLYKDWSQFFKALKSNKGKKKNDVAFSNASYPKAKKLSKVFHYSVPLEVSKFSLAKQDKGLLGITLGKRMQYVRYFNPKKGKPVYLNKIINSVTVSMSHGHIYYNLQYHVKDKEMLDKEISVLNQSDISNENENKLSDIKVAGLDIGLNNIASIFVNDKDTLSLIISGSSLISYNCYFNKKLAQTNQAIAKEVLSYKEIIKADGTKQKIPVVYSLKGKQLQYRRSQLFERRKLFMDDYMHKLSKKITNYLKYHQVQALVISDNLSFTKTDGSIKLQNKTQQKFYQIPFGRLLNLLQDKLTDNKILIKKINEAYTSKTSSLSADVVKVQEKSCQNQKLQPTDFNGSRGYKKSGQKYNPLGRGLFKDVVLNKTINADLNAAANHIKIGFNQIQIINDLKKFCNPKKIKSNHEFDMFLKTYQIVDRQKSLC